MAIENSKRAVIASIEKHILSESVTKSIINKVLAQLLRVLLDIINVRVPSIHNNIGTELLLGGDEDILVGGCGWVRLILKWDKEVDGEVVFTERPLSRLDYYSHWCCHGDFLFLVVLAFYVVEEAHKAHSYCFIIFITWQKGTK